MSRTTRPNVGKVSRAKAQAVAAEFEAERRRRHLKNMWKLGQRDLLKIRYYIAACISHYDEDSSLWRLAEGEDRLSQPAIMKATGFCKSTVNKWIKADVEAGIFTRTRHGNIEGKRGGGSSSYTWGPNAGSLREQFKSAPDAKASEHPTGTPSPFGLGTLRSQLTQPVEIDKKGREIFEGPSGERFYWKLVRRKVCCDHHRSPCVGHRARYRAMYVPHIVVKSLSELSSEGRVYQERELLECRACGAIVAHRRDHVCAVPDRHTAPERASTFDRLARHVNLGCSRDEWIDRDPFRVVRKQVLVEGRWPTAFERRWLSPTQQLLIYGNDYGYSVLQRSDLIALAKRVGFGYLINRRSRDGGFREPFLSFLADHCAAHENGDEFCDENDARHLMGTASRLLKDLAGRERTSNEHPDTLREEMRRYETYLKYAA